MIMDIELVANDSDDTETEYGKIKHVRSGDVIGKYEMIHDDEIWEYDLDEDEVMFLKVELGDFIDEEVKTKHPEEYLGAVVYTLWRVSPDNTVGRFLLDDTPTISCRDCDRTVSGDSDEFYNKWVKGDKQRYMKNEEVLCPDCQ